MTSPLEIRHALVARARATERGAPGDHHALDRRRARRAGPARRQVNCVLCSMTRPRSSVVLGEALDERVTRRGEAVVRAQHDGGLQHGEPIRDYRPPWALQLACFRDPGRCVSAPRLHAPADLPGQLPRARRRAVRHAGVHQPPRRRLLARACSSGPMLERGKDVAGIEGSPAAREFTPAALRDKIRTANITELVGQARGTIWSRASRCSSNPEGFADAAVGFLTGLGAPLGFTSPRRSRASPASATSTASRRLYWMLAFGRPRLAARPGKVRASSTPRSAA